MFLRYFQLHNEQVAALVGRQYTAGTLTKFRTVWKHTQEYIGDRYRRRDIPVRKIDHAFIAEFDFWLKSVKNIDHKQRSGEGGLDSQVIVTREELYRGLGRATIPACQTL